MKQLSFKLTALLILLSGSCLCTSARDFSAAHPKNYHYNKKVVVWEDDFKDNHNQWWTDKDSIPDKENASTIAEGYLQYRNTAPKRITAFGVDPNIDFNRDFEIEYSAKIITAYDKYRAAAVLFWARDSINNCYYLYTSQKGRLAYIALDAKNGKKVQINRYSKWFKKGAFNKVTIRKTGDKYYLFINEQFKKVYPYVPLPGKLVGLGAGPKAEVWYDYIRISYLEA